MLPRHLFPDTPDWAVHDLQAADFGDRRLSRRLATLVAQLSAHPATSVPQATGSWAAAKAAYRFWSSAHVSSSAILQPHVQRSLQRCNAYPMVLVIQDTTPLD